MILSYRKVLLGIGACGLLVGLSLGRPAPALAFGPVATRATCGPADRTESGLQGQTTFVERFAPGERRAFNCNLELVGQYLGQGTGPGFAITDKCAYMTQWQVPPPLVSGLADPGTVVIDASDPAHPRPVAHIKTPGLMQPAESLILDLPRKLLIGQNLNKSAEYGPTLEIYDVSDCLHPALKFSGIIPGYIFHGGDFSPDGTILWGTTGPILRSEYPDMGDTISALDITDPSHPKVIARWRTTDPRLVRFHGAAVSDDGNTLYFTIGYHTYAKVGGKVVASPGQGIGVLDVSEVQARKPNPRITLIGEPLFWSDIVHNQFIHPFAVKGHRYLWENRLDGVISNPAQIHVGDSGLSLGNAFKRPEASAEAACRQGKPAWGYVSIIDIQNPTHLRRVSAIKLQVQDARYCLATAYDPVFSHGYSPINCSVDDSQDARKMVCAVGESGVRVFDIRDIQHPREIAYYKPPAVGSAPRAASPYQTFRYPSGTTAVAKAFHSADAVADVAFAKGGREIWFTSFDNGFQVIRFSDALLKKERAVFSGMETCYGGLRPLHGCPGEERAASH